MSKIRKLSSLLFLSAGLLLGIIVMFNLLMIPRGLHLVKYIEQDTGEKNWVDHLMVRPLSGFIFKKTGNYCNFPFYTEGKLTNGDNATISVLISAFPSADSERKRNLVQAELENALNRCDPNVLGAKQPLVPIHMAIMYKNETIVRLLLEKNVKLDVKINREGTNIDQMTPVEFAKYLEEKETDRKRKESLKNIIFLIKEYKKK